MRNTHMLTPQYLFDGSLLAAGTVMAVSVNPSVGAATAGAAVSGAFICLAKLIELYIKARNDNRVKDLERQLRDAGLTPRKN